MHPWTIGIDLGATKVALGLIDPQDHVAARCRFSTVECGGPEGVVDRIAKAVAELSAALPAGESVAGAGLCSPGPLDHRTGVIIDPPNLIGWRNVPLKAMLSDRLGLPVVIEHDAKAAALGEYHYGAGQTIGSGSMVYIVVGTGVGAAIILNGELYRGAQNSAGEVGHITIDPQGEICSCGATGCVETFVAGPGLARAYRRALAADPAAAAEHPDVNQITGETVVRRAERGDPHARQVLARAGEALGTAVASLAMILDIDFYVVGSSVAKAGDLLLAPARAAVGRHAFRSVAGRVRIVSCALPDDGPLLGCSWLIRQALESERSAT